MLKRLFSKEPSHIVSVSNTGDVIADIKWIDSILEGEDGRHCSIPHSISLVKATENIVIMKITGVHEYVLRDYFHDYSDIVIALEPTG